MKRISHEPAFVLHSYPWSESSLILEIFTRHHGRVALVAKGVKRPSSQFRAVLLPLQPLQIAFSGDAEVQTLKAAEWQGGHTMPQGDALLSGYYINELLMRLLARNDPHESLFDAYAQLVEWLRDALRLQSSLRAFEMVLLREVGFLPALDMTSARQSALHAHSHYHLAVELGLREALDASSGLDEPALPGAVWLSLHEALHAQPALHHLRAAVEQLDGWQRQALKWQLRSLLNYHTGARGLRTHDVMRDVRALF